MNEEIKEYFENLNPKKVGLKGKIKVSSVKELGKGTSNKNYLVVANRKKFVFRINVDTKNKIKSKKEFESLKIVESLGVAPKAWFFDTSRDKFDFDLIVLSYIEGKTLNKLKNSLSDKNVKGFARVCAKIHSVKLDKRLKGLGIGEGTSSSTYFAFMREYLVYPNRKLKDKELLGLLNNTYQKLRRQISIKTLDNELVLSQGDFCEQNIIYNKGKYDVIDFEDLEITSYLGEIARIFTDFVTPFDEHKKVVFLREYSKIRKIKFDKDKIDKIEKFVPLILFSAFLWSVVHVLRIRNGEMHEEFMKGHDIKGDISYSKTMLKRLLRFGVIDKKYKDLDIKRALMR